MSYKNRVIGQLMLESILTLELRLGELLGLILGYVTL